MSIGKRLWLTLFALLITTPPAAAQQPLLINPVGPYIHQGSGFIFPAASGPFTRTRVIAYDGEATDVSAGYDLYEKGREAVFTIYVYPAPLSAASAGRENRHHECRDVFEGVKSDVARGHAGARLVEEGSIPSPSPHFAATGLDALFEYDTNFRGKEQPVRSEAVLYCYFGGKWLIKYRVTTPAAVDIRAELARLMLAVPWPKPE